MKRLMAVLFCVSVIFTFGCSQTDSNKETAQESTESAVSMGVVERTTEEWPEGFESENGTYPITLPLDPEVSQSLLEASLSEEASLNEQFAKYNAVDDVMHDVLGSKEFLEAETDEQKAEIVINAMKELALHGTETYPEPLIVYDSWVFEPDYQEVNAKYYDGLEFGVTWYDYNAESTDVTN